MPRDLLLSLTRPLLSPSLSWRGTGRVLLSVR